MLLLKVVEMENNIVLNFPDEENKKATDVALMVRHILADYNRESNNSYINLDEKEKNAAEAALTVMQKVLTDYNVSIENNYINFSDEKEKMGSNEIADPVANTTPYPRYISIGKAIFKSFDNLVPVRPDGGMVNAVVPKTTSLTLGNMGSSPIQGSLNLNGNGNIDKNNIVNISKLNLLRAKEAGNEK